MNQSGGVTLPSLTWRASPNYSSRGGQRTRLIVVHDCEGGYGGSVSWFANPASQVSAHIVLSEDGASTTQMVGWGNKAWHVRDFNGYSEGIEAAGFSAKGLGAAEWSALAAIVAYRLKANGLPCQVASSGNGWVGFCQHKDLGPAGGGHHDITSDQAVWDAFVKMVEADYADPSLPTSWGSSPAPAPVPRPPKHDLTPGSIEWVQMRLNALGFAKPPLTVDGLEGPATMAAVKAFQTAHDLDVDGDAGSLTIAAIKAIPESPA